MATKRATPIRVLIVDDLALQRQGYRQIIDSQPDMTVIGEAGSARAAGSFVRKEQTDVVLMDIRLPDADGLVATKRIVGDKKAALLGQNPRVVLVTALDRDTLAEAAREAGAVALLFKETDPETLLASIRTAALTIVR